MFEAAEVISLYAETPLHPGTGATRGAIDLPIQRERHTNFPVIPASTLKGVLRDAAEAKSRRTGAPTSDQVIEIFGPETKKGDLHGGALSPTDARLLLFPVRSLQGIFVWVTCPFVLTRLTRDLAFANKAQQVSVPSIGVTDGQGKIGTKSKLQGDPLILEEEEYSVNTAGRDTNVDTLATELQKFIPATAAYRSFLVRLSEYLVVVSDTDFQRLVSPGTGTDVVTRIKLNERKTTTGGGGNMWVEEYLPSDCLFYSLLLAMPSRSDTPSLHTGAAVLDLVRDQVLEKDTVNGKQVITHILQIGGDETVGRGWMRLHCLDGVPLEGGKSS